MRILAVNWISGYVVADIQVIAMPLYIKDDVTAQLVDQLAKRLGLTKQAAVRVAVQAQLDRIETAVPLRERFARLRAEDPLPKPTGFVADKEFFDRLYDNAK